MTVFRISIHSLYFSESFLTRNHADDALRRPQRPNSTWKQSTRPHAPAPRLVSAQLPMSTLFLCFLPNHVPLSHQHVYWSFVSLSTPRLIQHYSFFFLFPFVRLSCLRESRSRPTQKAPGGLRSSRVTHCGHPLNRFFYTKRNRQTSPSS